MQCPSTHYRGPNAITCTLCTLVGCSSCIYDSVIPTVSCTVCSPDYHVDNSNYPRLCYPNCLLSSSQCQTCSGNICTTCNTGYYAQTGSFSCTQCNNCTSCSWDSSLNDYNCDTCNTGLGYTLSTTSPKRCVVSGGGGGGSSCTLGPWAACVTCNGAVCGSCNSGYYLLPDGSCWQCHNPCATCSYHSPSFYNCDSCVSGRVLNTSSSPVQCVIPAPSSCSIGSGSSCATCNGMACATCNPGYF